MKQRIILVIVLPLLIVGAAVSSMIYTHSVSKSLLLTCELTRQAIRAEDYALAAERTEDMQRDWLNRRERLRLLIDHPDIDEVTQAIKALAAALEAEEKGDALTQTALLDEALRHLSHRDDPTLSNII